MQGQVNADDAASPDTIQTDPVDLRVPRVKNQSEAGDRKRRREQVDDGEDDDDDGGGGDGGGGGDDDVALDSRRCLLSATPHCAHIGHNDSTNKAQPVKKVQEGLKVFLDTAGRQQRPPARQYHQQPQHQKNPMRMLMRDWLQQQADRSDVPGLEWIDDSKTLMRIPWIHASRSVWSREDHGKLFENWAAYTGKFQAGVDKPNPRRWKANFRCALNSLPDVKEVSEMSSINGENGYKVYRFEQSEQTHKSGREDGRGRTDWRIFNLVRQQQDSAQSNSTSPTHIKTQPKNSKQLMQTTDDVSSAFANQSRQDGRGRIAWGIFNLVCQQQHSAQSNSTSPTHIKTKPKNSKQLMQTTNDVSSVFANQSAMCSGDTGSNVCQTTKARAANDKTLPLVDECPVTTCNEVVIATMTDDSDDDSDISRRLVIDCQDENDRIPEIDFEKVAANRQSSANCTTTTKARRGSKRTNPEQIQKHVVVIETDHCYA